MSEYLVTGGAGFIGSNIVERLLREGLSVRVIDNLSTGKEANLDSAAEAAGRGTTAELVRGDVRDDAALEDALRGVKYVFHEAALCSVLRSVEDPLSTNSVNVEGTLKLLVHARKAGVRRVVYASSSSVYGDTAALPNNEDLAPDPRSPYALSKLTAEHYCRLFTLVYGLETVCLRYFNVFGPRQDAASQYAAVIPLFMSRLLSGEPPVIFGDGEQSRDFTFVEDVVNANLLACHKPAIQGRVYNVARGRRRSVNELARVLSGLTGDGVRPVYREPRPAEVRHSEGSTKKVEAELGFKVRVGFEEGLERTLGWFRQQRASGRA
ncbi:MAG: SDR family oxidoreductase [Candidatus Eisenbacteria bacterium]|nr:SDR family oxidoreductase [Candidatus Eisenbacteria bacterium]